MVAYGMCKIEYLTQGSTDRRMGRYKYVGKVYIFMYR